MYLYCIVNDIIWYYENLILFKMIFLIGYVGVINMNFYSFRFYVIFIVIIECSEKYFDGK